MKMQPKKRQPPAQRTTKSVVTVKRRSKFEDEEEVKSDIEEKQIPLSPVNETIGLNFSSVNLIVNHKHKNNKEKEKIK